MRTILLLIVGILVGCGQSRPKGPTYNEALQTYENEMKVLDRLENEYGRFSTMELDTVREGIDHEKVQLRLEQAGIAEVGTVESRKKDREQRTAEYKAKQAELWKEIEPQRLRVAAAKKVVDELRK